MKAVLALGPSDTTDGVLAASIPPFVAFYGAKKLTKTKLAILTTVLDMSEL